MIVLDEQLLGRNIEVEISRWYPGAVRFITELRPGTIIKDTAIPHLLRQLNQPTFVTINEKDFWRKVVASYDYCFICFTLPDSRATEIPRLLRALFRLAEFKTKSRRMGKVVRVTNREIHYYQISGNEIRIDFR